MRSIRTLRLLPTNCHMSSLKSRCVLYEGRFFDRFHHTSVHVCYVLPEGLSEGSHNANLVSHHRVGTLMPIVPSNVFCIATTPDSVLRNLYDLSTSTVTFKF